MQALVYHGPQHKTLEDRPKPTVQVPSDAIVKVTKTTICGTDLRILKGDVATCKPGTILGHECGVLNGKVQPGSTVAIVGSGPIGLAALLTAQFYSPSEIIMIDLDANRLDVAKRFGATATVNSADGNAAQQVMTLTGGRGVDTAIEAVGIPATLELCQDIVAAGGNIANIGVHGAKVDLHLERLWSHNVTITTRLVDTVSIPMLLKTVQARRIDAKLLITHRFKLGEIL